MTDPTSDPPTPDPDDRPRRESAPDGRRPVTPLAPSGPAAGRASIYHPPRRCPPGMPCEDGEIGDGYVIAPGRYAAEALSHAEAAELTLAVHEAEADVIATRTSLDDATRDLVAAETAAAAALHRLDTFTRSNRLRDAYEAVEQVRRRHADDGPERRLHRPAWAKWAMIGAIVAASVYDTAFFSGVFARLVDSPNTWNDVRTYIGVLPGVMIAIALLTAGHWLAQLVARTRDLRERNPRRTPLLRSWFRSIPTERDADAMPWPSRGLAWGFGLLVVSIMGLWAFVRGGEKQGVSLQPTPAAYAVLLLLFTISAIAAEIVYYNPFLDAKRAVDRDLEAVLQERDTFVEAAERAITRYASAASSLATQADRCESQVRQRLLRAWTHILEGRDGHRRAGDVAPVFTEVEPDGARRKRTFDVIAQPAVWLTPIREARTVLQRHDVDAARAAYLASVQAMTAQVGPTSDVRDRAPS